VCDTGGKPPGTFRRLSEKHSFSANRAASREAPTRRQNKPKNVAPSGPELSGDDRKKQYLFRKWSGEPRSVDLTPKQAEERGSERPRAFRRRSEKQ
jgi:hypothetical protein